MSQRAGSSAVERPTGRRWFESTTAHLSLDLHDVAHFLWTLALLVGCASAPTRVILIQRQLLSPCEAPYPPLACLPRLQADLEGEAGDVLDSVR